MKEEKIEKFLALRGVPADLHLHTRSIDELVAAKELIEMMLEDNPEFEIIHPKEFFALKAQLGFVHWVLKLDCCAKNKIQDELLTNVLDQVISNDDDIAPSKYTM